MGLLALLPSGHFALFLKANFSWNITPKELNILPLGFIRILGIGLESACNSGSCRAKGVMQG